MVKYSMTCQPQEFQKLESEFQAEKDERLDTDTPAHHNTSVSPSTHRKLQEFVRKGSGITGLGVSNLHPHLSGRLTMKMLETMKKLRQDDMFEIEDDNEFDRVKQIVI